MSEQRIVIWELSAERIQAMERSLRRAMRRLGLAAQVQFNSEEPLLSRHQLLGSTPAVQVNGGELWRCRPGESITEEEFVDLFTLLRRNGLLRF